MDRVFLDANVLFSAAYKSGSGIMELWKLRSAKLASSRYAVEEARRNLATYGQDKVRRLDELLENVQIVDFTMSPTRAMTLSYLPEKDRPILRAAIAVAATHLLTGDVRHFGPYFGKRVEGVLVVTPAQYLQKKRA